MLVLDAVIIQKLKHRPEPAVVHEFDDRVELFELVLQRRAGEHQGVTTAELLDGPRRFRFPILDPLGLVEDNEVGLPEVERIQVPRRLLIVDEPIERRLRIQLFSLGS